MTATGRAPRDIDAIADCEDDYDPRCDHCGRDAFGCECWRLDPAHISGSSEIF